MGEERIGERVYVTHSNYECLGTIIDYDSIFSKSGGYEDVVENYLVQVDDGRKAWFLDDAFVPVNRYDVEVKMVIDKEGTTWNQSLVVEAHSFQAARDMVVDKLVNTVEGFRIENITLIGGGRIA